MALKKKKKSADDEEDEIPAKVKASSGNVKGARFVLFIGDEGTILIYIKGNSVQSRQFVPDASEQNLEELRGSLNDDPKAPILLVIDSMDQSYVQQTLPPVSAMSVKKLIKKRLERDFGPQDIKGALMLGRETTGRKDWNFLMVSIERSRQLMMWLDFVMDLPNRFQGIYLVSVETENVVKKLEKAMGVAKTGTGSKWKFFVNHNKVGGFRQVILQNGRIIFTRLAQPIGESTPEVIAGNIEQEMLSTIEYMKRLSFDQAEGLDVYIVASSGIKNVFDKNKIKANNFHIMTPFEMARYVGIEGATQPTDQFGDVVLAASISASPKHVLKLTTPESRKFDMLYQGSLGLRIAGVLLILLLLGYSGGSAIDIYNNYVESERLAGSKQQQQLDLDNLKAEIKKSNLDVEKTGDIIDLYQLLLKQKTAPNDFIHKASAVLKPPIIIKSLDWSVNEEAGPPGQLNSKATSKITALFTMEFPGVKDAEGFRTVSKKVLADLGAIFKDYDISFGKLPSKFSDTEKLDMTFSDAPERTAAEALDVQLIMKEK